MKDSEFSFKSSDPGQNLILNTTQNTKWFIKIKAKGNNIANPNDRVNLMVWNYDDNIHLLHNQEQVYHMNKNQTQTLQFVYSTVSSFRIFATIS